MEDIKRKEKIMIKEITEYFNCCIEGIVKTILLPIGIIIIIIKHLLKESEEK